MKYIFKILIFVSTFLVFSVFIIKKINHTEENIAAPGFDHPDKYSHFFRMISTPVGSKSSGYEMNYKMNELNNARSANARLKSTQEKYQWVLRGPGNVSGRTRSIIVDPDDKTYKTWFAGSASGGIWKTTDGGLTWQDLSKDFPYLSTNTLVMAHTNRNVIFAGTGEGYGGYGMVSGNGIFKSTNRGNTWTQLESTAQNLDFLYVNVIVIDPLNENIVITGTNTGIFKSVDGGDTWYRVYDKSYEVQDIVADPRNFSTLYAAANGLGILKSADAGENWALSSKGIGDGLRFHLAVSPVNPDKVFTSVEAIVNVRGSFVRQTHIYVSNDKGQNWAKFVSSKNFLGSQGWFNNIIEAHPFDENIVFIAGVDFGKIEFKGGTSSSDPQVLRVDTFGTGSFLRFINFGGKYLGGGMSTGDDEDGVEILTTDWSTVEIRFGEGIKQKAHRFTVPAGEGSGVPPDEYTYMDYTDVPFQAWDIDKNRQLMISFRDQERDGAFNLIERDPEDEISGREYFFIHAVPYNENIPSDKITKTGGHTYKQLYFFWPILADEKIWNADSIPASKILVEYGTFTLINQESIVTVLADYQKNSNLHVDHHEIITIITDSVNKKFTILEANDGGLGISYNEGKTWEQINRGYITTQFYGVAKKPGAHEYIGGMQDNGTWQSPSLAEATSTSDYSDKLAGDGFEALWHPVYPHRILGSSYNNYFYVSNDYGLTWSRTIQGVSTIQGPFITRLSHSPANPDLVFGVTQNGVLRHTNFGLGKFAWETIEIKNGWTNSINDVDALNVKVSLANDSVVWAGGGMYTKPDIRLFVSKNRGIKFNPVSNYTNTKLGYISGLATHPFNKETAYALFSYKGKPKILMTTDFGNSWNDITGFENNNTSSNGFPDVKLYSLIVMPYNTDIIWAGTEIGIFESTDNGISWHYADNGLPAVSVWQMFIQDNQMVVATHGRGIWSLDLNTVKMPSPEVTLNVKPVIYPNPNNGNFTFEWNTSYSGDYLVQVYASDGRCLYSEKFLKNSLVEKKQMHLNNLKTGNYILTIKYNNSVVSETIMVK
ncbi:MAG: T9SS type A sorting domain-containing protein [Bacteroidales bacterium]